MNNLNNRVLSVFSSIQDGSLFNITASEKIIILNCF